MSGAKKRKISTLEEPAFIDLTSANFSSDDSESGSEGVQFLGTSRKGVVCSHLLKQNVSKAKSINHVLRDKATDGVALRSLPPLLLTSPEQVALHTPCTLYLGILPPDLAERLYRTMLCESSDWQRNKWYLNDRQVESPHTTCFYSSDATQDTSHWYMGRKAQRTDEKPKTFMSEMLEARAIIEGCVNRQLNTGKRYSLEFNGPWQANVAAANCYRGAAEVSF